MTQTDVQFTSTNGRPAGAWQVAPGQALTLKSARGGRVRVASGGLWATFDGPHAGAVNDRGDHLLEAGAIMALRPGERLVVEPTSRTAGASIEWESNETATDLLQGVRVVRSNVLGAQVRATAVRLLLALAAVGVTAGLWLGAAAESGRHRGDPQVLAGRAPRTGTANARPATPPATARAPSPRSRPPA